MAKRKTGNIRVFAYIFLRKLKCETSGRIIHGFAYTLIARTSTTLPNLFRKLGINLFLLKRLFGLTNIIIQIGEHTYLYFVDIYHKVFHEVQTQNDKILTKKTRILVPKALIQSKYISRYSKAQLELNRQGEG